MISVVESEIKSSLKKVLDYLLSSPQILENNVLSTIPDKNKKSFIETFAKYGGNKGIDIPVYDTFPQEPPTNGAFFLIQFEASEDDLDSQSLAQDTGYRQSNDEGEVYEESHLEIQTKELEDGTKQAYVTLPMKAHDIIGIKQLTDYQLVNGDTITFKYFDIYDKDKYYLDVIYSKSTGLQGKSLPAGVTMLEKISIDFVSTNMDVLKCLYAIMIYAQAYFKQSLEFNHNVFLPTFKFQGNDVIAEMSQDNSNQGNYLYYRRLEITVHTVQSISLPATKELTEINIDYN